jgi:spermidine synthase
MMGMKGPGRSVKEEEIRRLWNNGATGADLKRIGIEVPQQLGALFLMDGEEIERITQGIAPLTDSFPKRLSAARWDEQASHRLASTYVEASSAHHRFLWSPLINRIWPETLNKSLDSFFVVRETRYLSELIGSNKLAELDLYLRGSRLRTPVLEVLGSDEFRLAIAEGIAQKSETPPTETLPDLIAGALARRDIRGAIQLLEREKSQGIGGLNDLFLLIYLYCLNGNVEKAETLVVDNAASFQKDWFVDWLWTKLQADFGFRPPL